MLQFILKLPAQSGFTIKTNCCRLANALQRLHGSYLSQCVDEPWSVIEAYQQPNSQYTITFEGRLYKTEAPLYKIDELIFTHTCYDSEILALHGAAVAWRGKAYLFLAATTSGKTTLTSYLCSRGMDYITDDCVLVDRRDHTVLPCAEPIHLREGGVEVLRQHGILPDNLDHLNELGFERFLYTPSQVAQGPLPLGRIFFISRTGNNLLHSMDTNSRMQALLHAPITPYPMTANYLRDVAALARQDCFQLEYQELAYVEGLLHGE